MQWAIVRHKPHDEPKKVAATVSHDLAGVGNKVGLDGESLAYHHPNLVFSIGTQAGVVDFDGLPGAAFDRVDFAFATLAD
ncbi:MAG: hypothetical protein TEF_18960 [Rhizobiales bacterium NRL2]|nr:MAG: hypothetical protein TEF_18960 [Rhizobiales bacterium NRL2]